jgi:hypothetical protein
MTAQFNPLRLAFLEAVLVFGLFASAKPSGDFVIALESSALAAQHGTNPVVSISSVTDFGWDKLFIFGPYTPVDRIQAQLGYRWTEAHKTHIDSSDTFYLLVFVKEGKVLRHFKFPRTTCDFQSIESGNEFSPGEDTFEVKSVGAGQTTRLNLFPKRKGQPDSEKAGGPTTGRPGGLPHARGLAQSRTPARWPGALEGREASWSAAVPCRFSPAAGPTFPPSHFRTLL